MDHQMKDMICKHLDTELSKIANMQSINDVALANLQRLTDTKKNLLKIELLESQLNDDMMDGDSYRRGRSYRGSYDGVRDGNSNRYMMPGRIYSDSYDMGYSRNDSYSHLEAAMRDARNEQEREEIRQLMSRYYK